MTTTKFHVCASFSKIISLIVEILSEVPYDGFQTLCCCSVVAYIGQVLYCVAVSPFTLVTVVLLKVGSLTHCRARQKIIIGVFPTLLGLGLSRLHGE